MNLRPKTLARIAGSLYLLASVLFIFSIYVRSTVKTEPTQIAPHIQSSAVVFRIGLASDLVSGVLFLLTAMALYLLLQHVQQTAAAAMVVFVVVLVTVLYLNDLNQFDALTIATNPSYARTFGVGATNSLVTLLLQAQINGLVINEMFFGLWLVPLGYLVIRSRQFPALIGALILVAAVNWLAQFAFDVLLPGISYGGLISQLFGIGEIVFVAWLLIFGIGPARHARGADAGIA